MKRCFEQLPLGHCTRPNLRARRAAAWERTPPPQAPIQTRMGPFLFGLLLALLTSSVFLGPAQAATTELVSRTASGGQGNSNSRFGAISPDGRFVVFQSGASNLVS